MADEITTPQPFDAVQVETNIQHATIEEFISRGLELREKKDNINWELGDLASDVTKEHGPKFLSNFSKGIGIEVSTIKRYRDVARAYPPQVRFDYKMLSWTHFREVAAHPDRNKLLAQAVNEEWSVEKLRIMAKPEAERPAQGTGNPSTMDTPPQMEQCPDCKRWRFVEDVQLCPNDGRCEYEFK